jgi:hypothetical protein
MTYPQLCAISREILAKEPGMLDAEWKARIKERVLRLGFGYPPPELLSRAMNAVQAAYEKTHGRRPVTSLRSEVLPIQTASKPESWRPEPSGRRSVSGPVALRDLAAHIRLLKPSEPR